MKLFARALASIVILSSTLSGCASLTSLSGPKPKHDPVPVMCDVFQTISWNKKDTDQTIREVKAHNGVWMQLCGPIKRPAPPSLPNLG